MGYKLPITLERPDEGFIATCDELNAIASGATEEEALKSLQQAIEALMETYSRNEFWEWYRHKR